MCFSVAGDSGQEYKRADLIQIRFLFVFRIQFRIELLTIIDFEYIFKTSDRAAVRVKN
jgi:hypothetical protein